MNLPHLDFGVIVIIAVAIGILAVLVNKAAAFPYRKAGPLLSPAERQFFGVLERAAPAALRVFVKVRVADVITVKRDGRDKRTIVALNRIAAKHLDYVLVDRTSMESVAAIELDDSSHARADRRARDSFLDQAMKAAGVPLLRFKPRGRYDAAEIRAAIDVALSPQTTSEAGKARQGNEA